MVDVRELRAQWALSSRIRFLNHGAFGACPRVVLEAQSLYRDALEEEPVRFLARDLVSRLDDVRSLLGEVLGARPRDLGFVPNATTGVNAVLRSLALGAGDEIVITDHGYNACSNAAEFVAARAGARVVVAQVPFPLASEDAVLEAILAAVTPRTRLALIDHVTSPTALVLPIERIVRALRERGVETLVDGAHGPGMVELNLADAGMAYYAGNCHKWLCSPKGAAFLYVREDLQETVRPAVISHGANEPRTDRSRFQVEFDWVGTSDPTAVLAVKDSIEFLRSALPGGLAEVRARNRALALEARSILADALGGGAPAPDAMLASMATVPLADGDPDGPRGAFDVDPLQGALYDEHGIEVPIFFWPRPPRRVMRVSAQLYNGRDDYEALARALAALDARTGGFRSRPSSPLPEGRLG